MVEVVQVKAGASGVARGVLVILPLCLLGLWWWPRPAIPVELPSLVLPRAEVVAAIAAEDALARAAPDSASEERRRAAYLEQGRAELRGLDTPASARARLTTLRSATEALAEEGPDAVAAARAADVLRMERALSGEGTEATRAGELGMFARSLERWHAVEGGTRIAPRLVVRALASARWNAIHDRELTEGLSPLHLRAYHGWLALHGAIGASELRGRALMAYGRAGGARVHEARGVLLFLEGAPDLAAPELLASFEATGNLRVRNHWLAAVQAE